MLFASNIALPLLGGDATFRVTPRLTSFGLFLFFTQRAAGCEFVQARVKEHFEIQT